VSSVSSQGESGRLVGETLGGCHLVELLGVGGMAEVYRGVEPQLGREVAVKVVAQGQAADAGYVERFRDEARQVAALSHPNVVPIYRFGEERGRLYLVMPLYTESLRDRLTREGRLDPNEAARICVQIAAGLDAAHRQGLVHRDVKPENILLNADGRAMLTDFGIARDVRTLSDAKKRSTVTGTGLPVGTPEYMAPEQLRGGPIDQRADVYALGAVLFEMLTGEPPYAADTVFEVAARALTERTPLPSERNPEIWPELDDVALGALAPDPESRYPDVRSMVVALRRAVLQRGATTTQLSVRDIAPHLAEGAGDAPLPSPMPHGFMGFNAPTQALVPRSETDVVPIWRPAQMRQRPRRRLRTVALVAAGLVVFVGSMTLGLALAPRIGLLSAWLDSGQITLPIGNGLGSGIGQSGTEATATAQATALGGNSTRPTQPAGGAGNTPTAAPTGTPSPTATSTPTPSVTFIPSVSLSGKHRTNPPCTGQQVITNPSSNRMPATWSLSAPPDPNISYSVASGTLQPGESANVFITYSGPLQCNAQPGQIDITVSGGQPQHFTVVY
jgi:Protein kinase domain